LLTRANKINAETSLNRNSHKSVKDIDSLEQDIFQEMIESRESVDGELIFGLA